MVGVHDYRMEGLLPSKAWQPGLGTERQTVAFIQDRVTFLLVLLRTIIPPLISAPGIKLFTTKTGSLKNKNMSINHESRTFVAV